MCHDLLGTRVDVVCGHGSIVCDLGTKVIL